MMQIKFNVNNFMYFITCLPQPGSVQWHTPSSLAAVIGMSNNDVISLHSLRSLSCVRWMENPLKARFRRARDLFSIEFILLSKQF